MKHPNTVQDCTPEVLAIEFANTNYEYQQAFFKALANEYQEQSEADFNRKRIHLSNKLFQLTVVLDQMDMLWGRIVEICKPHMKGNGHA